MSIISNSPEIMFAADRLRKAPNGQRMAEFQKIVEEGKTNFAAVAAAMELVKKAERMSQQPSQRPTTTVAEDLEAKLSQINQAKKREEQGIAGLPNDLMANANFSSGITSGMAEEPPLQQMNMAGGGIVAFAGGGGAGASTSTAYADLMEDFIRRTAAENNISQDAVRRELQNPKSSLWSKLGDFTKYVKNASAVDLGKAGLRQIPGALRTAGIYAVPASSINTAFDMGFTDDPSNVSTDDLRQVYGYGPAEEGIAGFFGDVGVRSRAALADTASGLVNWMPFVDIDTAVDEARRRADARVKAADPKQQQQDAQKEGPATLDDYAMLFGDQGGRTSDVYGAALAGIPSAGALLKGVDFTAPEKYMSEDEQLKNIRDREGTESAADKEMLAQLQSDRESLEKGKKRDTWLAAAKGFFAAAAEAEKGTSTLGVIAKGAEEGLNNYTSMLSELKKDEKELRNTEYQLKKSQEAFSKDQTTRAYDRFVADRTNYNMLKAQTDAKRIEAAKINFDIWAKQASISAQLKIAQMDEKNQDQLWLQIGDIITRGVNSGLTKSAIDAKIDEHLNLVARMTIAKSGSAQASMMRTNADNALLDRLMGGGEGTEGWGDVSVSGK